MKWADIVLPATTCLEHSDLYLSYWHWVIQWADAVIEPVGESRPNIAVFNELAWRLGFHVHRYRYSKHQELIETIKSLARMLLQEKETKFIGRRLHLNPVPLKQ